MIELSNILKKNAKLRDWKINPLTKCEIQKVTQRVNLGLEDDKCVTSFRYPYWS